MMPSVQSLLAAGHHILPLEEGVVGGKHIDLRRLMVCLDFNEHRSSYVTLHVHRLCEFDIFTLCVFMQ